MKTIAKLLSITLIMSLFNFTYSQFCNTATSNDVITPTTTLQFTTAYTTGRRAFTFNAIAGNEYTFSTVGQSTIDTYLKLYNSATGGTILTESDDYNGTQAEITWYCSVSGTYSVFLTRWTAASNCAALNSSTKIKYQMNNTSGNTIVAIGYNEGVVYQVPANHYYNYGWSEMIYLKSEINTDGYIRRIRFQVEPSLTGTYVAENQKIYMAHTTYSTFPNAAVKENAQTNYASSNYTLVFNGTVNWSLGWVEIILDTPFPWNNIDNLLIKYENREGTYSASYPTFYYTTKTSTVGYSYQDISYPTADGARDGFRPNIKLVLSNPVSLPVELVSFDGRNNSSYNILYWSTASENNSNYFDLEKSINGYDWKTVSKLNAMGNSTTLTRYSSNDYNIDTTINYYRLTQYDINGDYYRYGPISIDNRISGHYIIKYFNLLGQEVDKTHLGPTIIMYNDGIIKRIFK